MSARPLTLDDFDQLRLRVGRSVKHRLAVRINGGMLADLTHVTLERAALPIDEANDDSLTIVLHVTTGRVP